MDSGLNNFIQLALCLLLLFYTIKLIKKWTATASCANKAIEGGLNNVLKAELLNLSRFIFGFLSLIFYSVSKSASKTALEFCQHYLQDKNILTATFPIPFILIRGYETMRQTQNQTSHRPRPAALIKSLGEGIIFNNTKTWKGLRSHMIKSLGQLGFGKKNAMSKILQTELQDMLEHLDWKMKESENRIPARDLFVHSVVNVVWGITAGESFSRDDPKCKQLLRDSYTITKIPLLKYILFEWKPARFLIRMFPSLFGYSKFFNAVNGRTQYFKEYVERRQETGEYKLEGEKDFIDRFLQELDANKYSENESVYCTDELVALLVDIFHGGMESSSNSLEAAVMWMIKFPNVQKTIQEEIDDVLGASGVPTPDHKHMMPFTAATVLEINRISNIFPVNLRSATEDCVLGDVTLKKGAWAVVQLHCVNMNEDFWGDPKEFRPERFLDQDNNFVQEKVNQVIAFGGGQRYCPGEMVANWTIFVFLAGILQRYNLTRADKKEILRMQDYFSMINRVVPFHFSVTLR